MPGSVHGSATVQHLANISALTCQVSLVNPSLVVRCPGVGTRSAFAVSFLRFSDGYGCLSGHKMRVCAYKCTYIRLTFPLVVSFDLITTWTATAMCCILLLRLLFVLLLL